MKERKHVFAASAVAGAAALLLSQAPSFAVGTALDRLGDGGASWLPMFGTVGETATLYIYAVDVLAGIGLLAPGFLLGYGYLRRDDVRSDFRRLGGAVVAGSTAGVVLVGGVAVALVAALGGLAGGSLSPWTITVVVLAALRAFVEVALVVSAAALAGVAVATFDAGPRQLDGDAANPGVTHDPTVRDD